ncbi:MAG: carboxymuconolactone decarboxylase family protein [Gemmatimonadales bacterium]
MAFLKSLPQEGVLLNLFRMFPDTSLPLIQYHEVLMRGPSSFTVAERELIAAYVSGINSCSYCHGVHTATAERFGIDEGLLVQLLDDLDTAGIAEKMKPILRYAAKLTRMPSRVTQNDADTIFAAGWSDRALYETVSVCALFNFMNRLVDGLGITADVEYFEFAGRRLSEGGYAELEKLVRAGDNESLNTPKELGE